MKKIILLLCILISGCKVTSEGEKIGVIVKCANEGIIFTTYECEIIRGGLNSASGAMGKSFDFTVENKTLIPMFEKALNDQKQVKIKYHKELITSFGRTETSNNSFADNIEFLN